MVYMLARVVRHERGMTLVVVLIMLLLMSAIGAVLMTAADRNSEMRGTYQKTVAGFQAAEAGINVGADLTMNSVANNALPTGSTCNANFGGSPLSINGRTVTYTLSGCGQTPVLQTLPADDPFAGLSADVYTYTLTSTAVNSAGFTEGSLKMQFYARQIPMFQFQTFTNSTYALTPGTVYLVTGRIHTNGDLYLTDTDCGSSGSGGGGMQMLGQVTFVGNLYRGNRQSVSSGHVWISTDGTQANETIFGITGPGDTSCGPGAGRGPIPQSELNSFNGRVRNVKNITMPGGYELYCSPWSCPGSMTAGSNIYWQKADLRLVLDLTASPAHLVGAFGPALPPINVVDASGNVVAAATTSLHTMMQNNPGIITYTDVPTSGTIDCWASISGTTTSCEPTYANGANYTPKLPNSTSTCPVAQVSQRGGRALITSNNYCYDYRYGGYYDWKDGKPRILLNVDWMALEEYNHNNANVFFNPAGATASNNGLVVYLTVRGANSAGVNNYGVRVFDAARDHYATADPGVTFATDENMYLAGNFNCATPNTSGGTSVPETCGTGGQVGSSIVGDKVDFLSCAWPSSSVATTPCSNFSTGSTQWPGWANGNVSTYRLQDERSTQGPVPSGYPSPNSPGGAAGTTTFFNLALLSGFDPTWCTTDHTGNTCAGNWSTGGSPNLVENWGGQNFWWVNSNASADTTHHTCYAYYTGINPTNDPSFSCTTHTYQGANTQLYAPPAARLFFFDSSFTTPANWPPLTPFVASLRQVLFTEPFQ